MKPREAYERRDEVTFVDVREWYEWEAGTVKGSLHVPVRMLAERVHELPADRPMVVLCQVGQRSAVAAEFLAGRGRDAHNLEGGVEAWTAEGLPLVSADGADGRVTEGWGQLPDLH